MLPRHLCSKEKETRPKTLAGAETADTEAAEEGYARQLEATEELVPLIVMAIGFVDAMWNGTRHMGHATLCFALAENICRRQSVQYLEHVSGI